MSEKNEEIKTVLEYYSPKNESVTTKTGFRYLDTGSTLTSTKEISAKTEHELFIRFYKLNNKLRYCNETYYKFADGEMEKKYAEWLNSPEYKAISFDLYYGSETVD